MAISCIQGRTRVTLRGRLKSEFHDNEEKVLQVLGAFLSFFFILVGDAVIEHESSSNVHIPIPTVPSLLTIIPSDSKMTTVSTNL